MDDVELVRDLGAAQDRHERTDGIFERVRHDGKLFFDEESAYGGLDKAVFHYARRGSMRTVSRSESVVDEDVAEGGELTAEFLVVALFFHMEARVFQKHAFAFLASLDFRLSVGTDHVFGKSDLAVQKLVEPVGDGLQGELHGIFRQRLSDGFGGRGAALFFGQGFDRLLFFLVQLDIVAENAVRLAKMGAKNDLRAVFHQILNGGKSAHYTVVVRDNAVLHGHVEVAPDQAALALHVYVSYGFLVHNKTPFLK